jgi:hypothetical protein
MTIASYADLQTRLSDLLNRDDLDDKLVGFIGLAEAEMSGDLQDHWRLEKRSTATISTRYTALPADWQGAMRISTEVNGRVQDIDLCSTAEMANLRRVNNITGTPTKYAITGGELELYPTPSGAMEVELLYLGGVDPLTDVVTTNWVLQQAPDAYLYGAAKHSAPWLRDDQRLVTWEGFYRAAINRLMLQAKKAKHGGTGLKIGFRSN